MEKDTELHCSFCGKEQKHVSKLIAGTSGYICNECIELCHDMLLSDAVETQKSKVQNNKNYPHHMKFVHI